MSEYDNSYTSTTAGPDTDAQYRTPTQTPPQDQGIEWLPNLPFVGNGKRVCDEANPSWEEVITMVVIPGHPDMIREASGAWEVLFRNVEQAKGLVDQVISSVSGWEGQTATGFKNHMTKVGQGMTELVGKHRPVVQHLNTAADNLDSALDTIKIPDDMVDDVMQARRNFGESGSLNTYKPGFFFDALFPIFSNRWLSELGSFITFGFTDWAKKKLRNWLTDNDEEAQRAYKALAGQHVTTMDSMPKGEQIMTQDDEAAVFRPTRPPSTGSGMGNPDIGAGGAGGGGGGGAGLNPEDYNTSLAGAGGLTGAGAGSGLGGLGGAPGAGSLAGAGGLGSGGAPSLSTGSAPGAGSAGSAIRGGGMAGMPMGGMGGMGAGAGGGTRSPGGRMGGASGMPMSGMGAGAAGRGGGAGGRLGAGGAGRAGGMGGMAGMGAGAAGAGGRGAGGAGRTGGATGSVGSRTAGGAGRAGAGMAGMGAGAGAGGDQAADHTTWLEEDEDPWGTDTDAAPPVLG